MFDKSRRDNEVTNYLTRFLLDLAEEKDEFDHMLPDRDSSTFFEVEVKSYPQDGILDKDGLEKSLKKASSNLFLRVPISTTRSWSNWGVSDTIDEKKAKI